MIVQPTLENIQKAADILRQQGCIGFPTETVYGLAADATQDQAIAHIYEKKSRPTFNPLIIHGYSQDTFSKHVHWNEKAELLAQAFWPGPLTLVLPRLSTSSISFLASAGLSSVAIRVPSHPTALNILQSFGGLLAAPSANLSGKISPTQSIHVEQDFPDLLIFEGGPASIGLESTIVDLTGAFPALLRPGGISWEEIESTIGHLEKPSFSPIKAPGMLESHYAPTLPLRLNAEKPLINEAYLAFGPTAYQGSHVLNLSLEGNLREAASNFFTMLRLLDRPSFQRIAVAPIPWAGLGIALNDRLLRVAAPRGLLEK
jgi:L-threonylcarbamoyladenylate synthase